MTLQPMDHGVLRVGQPRKRWYTTTLADLWNDTKTTTVDNSIRFAGTINLSIQKHVDAIKQHAQTITEKAKKKRHTGIHSGHNKHESNRSRPGIAARGPGRASESVYIGSADASSASDTDLYNALT